MDVSAAVVHVIDSNIPLWVGINGGHPTLSNLRQQLHHSGVTYHGHVWKFLPVLSEYTWRRPEHQVAFTHKHMYKSIQTGSQTTAPRTQPALEFAIQVCTHVAPEITFKSTAQLLGLLNRAAHTLRLSFTHIHTASINSLCLIFLPDPSSYPMWSRWTTHT